ncbi:toluene tolerance family protein [mine drainage metagenome]|uniref:Toluene tolerance family protein n=2 Tax=mine drainage metagenome TaxID=410659 RepID=T1CYW9_9ZZZZ
MRFVLTREMLEAITFFICVFFGLSAGNAYAHIPYARPAALTPPAVIQNFDQALLQAMHSGKLGGFSARYRILSPVIHNSFATKRIAQLLVGPAWSRFSPPEQTKLGILFERYTIANYASQFRRFHGETFKIIGTQPYPPYQVVVAKLFESNGHSHTFTYLMEPIQRQWKIVNIFVDGVSNIALMRSQYLYIVRKSGPEGLLHYLQSMITHLEKHKH